MKPNSQGVRCAVNRLVKLGLVFASATALAGTGAKADAITGTLNGMNAVTNEFMGDATIGPTSNGGWTVNGTAQSTQALGLPDVFVTNVTMENTITNPMNPGVTSLNASGFTPPVPPNLNLLDVTFRQNPTGQPAGMALTVETVAVNGLGPQASVAIDSAGNVISGSLEQTIPLPAGLSNITQTYTITPLGLNGSLPLNTPFNMGINALAVPGPIVGAGLPGLIAALCGLVAMARRRRNQLA